MSLRLNTNYNENESIWEIELIGEVDINSKSTLKDELIQLNEKRKSDFLF